MFPWCVQCTHIPYVQAFLCNFHFILTIYSEYKITQHIHTFVHITDKHGIFQWSAAPPTWRCTLGGVRRAPTTTAPSATYSPTGNSYLDNSHVAYYGKFHMILMKCEHSFGSKISNKYLKITLFCRVSIVNLHLYNFFIRNGWNFSEFK